MAYNYRSAFETTGKIPPDVTRFLQAYRATASLGEVRKEYRSMPYDFRPSISGDETFASFHTEAYYQQIVNLSITEDDFKRLISDVDEVRELEKRYGPNIMEFIRQAHENEAQIRYEQRARHNNPGVKLAWEKYQMMLKIAGE